MLEFKLGCYSSTATPSSRARRRPPQSRRLLALSPPKVRGTIGSPRLPSPFPPSPGRRRALQRRHHGRRRSPPPAAVCHPPRSTSVQIKKGETTHRDSLSLSPTSQAPTSPQGRRSRLPPARCPPPLFSSEGRKKIGQFCPYPQLFSLFH